MSDEKSKSNQDLNKSKENISRNSKVKNNDYNDQIIQREYIKNILSLSDLPDNVKVNLISSLIQKTNNNRDIPVKDRNTIQINPININNNNISLSFPNSNKFPTNKNDSHYPKNQNEVINLSEKSSYSSKNTNVIKNQPNLHIDLSDEDDNLNNEGYFNFEENNSNTNILNNFNLKSSKTDNEAGKKISNLIFKDDENDENDCIQNEKSISFNELSCNNETNERTNENDEINLDDVFNFKSICYDTKKSDILYNLSDKINSTNTKQLFKINKNKIQYNIPQKNTSSNPNSNLNLNTNIHQFQNKKINSGQIPFLITRNSHNNENSNNNININNNSVSNNLINNKNNGIINNRIVSNNNDSTNNNVNSNSNDTNDFINNLNKMLNHKRHEEHIKLANNNFNKDAYYSMICNAKYLQAQQYLNQNFNPNINVENNMNFPLLSNSQLLSENLLINLKLNHPEILKQYYDNMHQQLEQQMYLNNYMLQQQMQQKIQYQNKLNSQNQIFNNNVNFIKPTNQSNIISLIELDEKSNRSSSKNNNFSNSENLKSNSSNTELKLNNNDLIDSKIREENNKSKKSSALLNDSLDWIAKKFLNSKQEQIINSHSIINNKSNIGKSSPNLNSISKPENNNSLNDASKLNTNLNFIKEKLEINQLLKMIEQKSNKENKVNNISDKELEIINLQSILKERKELIPLNNLISKQLIFSFDFINSFDILKDNIANQNMFGLFTKINTCDNNLFSVVLKKYLQNTNSLVPNDLKNFRDYLELVGNEEELEFRQIIENSNYNNIFQKTQSDFLFFMLDNFEKYILEDKNFVDINLDLLISSILHSKILNNLMDYSILTEDRSKINTIMETDINDLLLFYLGYYSFENCVNFSNVKDTCTKKFLIFNRNSLCFDKIKRGTIKTQLIYLLLLKLLDCPEFIKENFDNKNKATNEREKLSLFNEILSILGKIKKSSKLKETFNKELENSFEKYLELTKNFCLSKRNLGKDNFDNKYNLVYNAKLPFVIVNLSDKMKNLRIMQDENVSKDYCILNFKDIKSYISKLHKEMLEKNLFRNLGIIKVVGEHLEKSINKKIEEEKVIDLIEIIERDDKSKNNNENKEDELETKEIEIDNDDDSSKKTKKQKTINNKSEKKNSENLKNIEEEGSFNQFENFKNNNDNYLKLCEIIKFNLQSILDGIDKLVFNIFLSEKIMTMYLENYEKYWLLPSEKKKLVSYFL